MLHLIYLLSIKEWLGKNFERTFLKFQFLNIT